MKLKPAKIVPCMIGYFLGIFICVAVLCETFRKLSVGIPIDAALKHVEAFCLIGTFLSMGCLFYLVKVVEEIIRRLNSLPHDEK